MKRKHLSGKEIQCSGCKKHFTFTGKTGFILFRSFPYAVAIQDDRTKYWICDDYYYRSAEDI